MKKVTLYLVAAFGLLALNACCNKDCDKNEGVNNDSLVHEGRIVTHTTKTHVIHQDISEDEREMVKDNITTETTAGASSVSIDSVGAAKINSSRN